MRRALLLAGGVAALALPAHADDVEEPTEVGEIIVTATRVDTPRPEVAGAHVIDAERIEASGAVLAADILQEIPGVSLYSQGAFGGVTSIRLRGAGQDKTLVLLDGVALNDPSQPAGGYDFAGLELFDIARIEVLSGPQGSLWGSDAIGGVIALTTRAPGGARLDLEAGSLGTLRAAGSIGTSHDRWALGLSGSVFETGGVSRADARDGNTERDGFENRTLGLAGRLTLGPVTFDARARWNDAIAELDGYDAAFVFGDTDEVSVTESLSGFVRARFAALGLDHALTWQASEIDRAITGGAFPSRYVGERRAVRWQAERELLYHTVDIAFGLEREETKGDLSTGDAAELGATSAFAVARANLTDRLTLSGSLRWDDPEDYAAETTARLSAAYELTPGLTLSGSWGQGFKTPTISQTVCDFCVSASPFPALTPERAEGFDLGLAWRSADGDRSARIVAFRLEVEDEITFVFDGGTFDSYYVNLGRTRSTGVELEGSWAITPSWELRGAYAFIDAEDAATGARLLRVPEQSGSFTAAWSGGPWRAALTVRGESDQADAGGEREGFVVARFAGGYAMSDAVELTLRIENLTDAHYQEALFYGEPGRTAYAGIRLRY